MRIIKIIHKKLSLKYKTFVILLVIILVFALLVSYIAITKQGISINKPYDKHLKIYSTDLTQEELYLQDLEFIYQEINNNYVNLEYKEETFGFSWDQQYEYCKAQLNKETSKKDLYRICNEFISVLKDGHTWFGECNTEPEERVWAPYSNGIVSAFEIRLIEERPIIVANRLNQELNGYEVVSINNILLFDILNVMLNYNYRGGNDVSAKSHILRRNIFYQYFVLLNDKFPDQFVFELKDLNGEIKTILLDSNVTFQDNIYINNEINFGIWDNELPVYYIKDNIGYIRIDSFNNKPKDIVDAFDRAVKDCKKTGVDGVVLDLRNNGGGNESFREVLGYLSSETIYMERFHYKKSQRFQDIFYLRFLWDMISSSPSGMGSEEGYTKWRLWISKPAKEQFLTTVPVVVLCNENIFSSTNSFVLACLDKKLATVVGNMVPQSGFGLSTEVLLPSGNYVLSYCFFESQTHDGEPLENVIMEPDVIASQTYEDFRKGIDTQLEAAFKVIRDE